MLVAVDSCRLRAAESPVCPCSAFGMSLRLSELVLACYLLCCSFVDLSSAPGHGAAVTILRGLTPLPQPLREKLVLDSIYLQVEKNQRALQREGGGKVLQISVFPALYYLFIKVSEA